jgi:hypothetical protein
MLYLKTSAVPIWMHQVCISTIYVSSMILGLKNIEIQYTCNVKTIKIPKKAKMGYEMEPNPSKDRAVHEGGDPSV